MPTVKLKNDSIAIQVDPKGAELCSFRDANNNELLWQADEKFWPRHAPILFPIVGRLKNDQLLHQGRAYPMNQHGFARDMNFECIEQQQNLASFRLRDSKETRLHYPFAFELIVNYALLANRLMIVYTVRNYHEQELPFSIGGHPAFNWPLFPATQADEYSILFEQAEASHIWQLNDGLVGADLRATPLEGNCLKLKPELFDQDALIFPDVNSQSVFYGNAKGEGLTINFTGFPDLGIWSKAGAPFVCIEPWSGHASPEGFDAEFLEKPGVQVLPPHSEHSLSYSIEVNI